MFLKKEMSGAGPAFLATPEQMPRACLCAFCRDRAAGILIFVGSTECQPVLGRFQICFEGKEVKVPAICHGSIVYTSRATEMVRASAKIK